MNTHFSGVVLCLLASGFSAGSFAYDALDPQSPWLLGDWNGERQKLNLGHTVGHAVEKLSHFSVSHGSAVAIGLAVISRASAANGCCAPDTAERIVNALTALALPTKTEETAGALSNAMLSDKKRSGDRINLIVPRAVGHCEIMDMPVEGLAAYIEKGL